MHANPKQSGIELEEKKKTSWKSRLALIACLAAALAAYLFIPAIHNAIGAVVAAFASGDFEIMREFVASYGVYAAAVSFLLMILQSVAAPLPAFLLTITNANLFGWWQGAILSWCGAMAGATLCFWIARILGQDAVEKLITKAGLQSVDRFFERYGTHSILICRLLPFVSFDFVSYAAGLTQMSFWSFFVATGIGQLPATIVYSYVGGMLTGGAQMLVTGLLVLFALGVLAILLKSLYTMRTSKDRPTSDVVSAENEA